jgi:hypothetical protein
MTVNFDYVSGNLSKMCMAVREDRLEALGTTCLHAQQVANLVTQLRAVVLVREDRQGWDIHAVPSTKDCFGRSGWYRPSENGNTRVMFEYPIHASHAPLRSDTSSPVGSAGISSIAMRR